MFFLTKPENPTAACSLKGLLNKTHLRKRFAICKIKLDRQFDCFQKTYELVHLYCPGLPNWLCWWDLTLIEEQQLQLLMKNMSTAPALAEVGSVCSESPSSPCSSSGNVWKITRSKLRKAESSSGTDFPAYWYHLLVIIVIPPKQGASLLSFCSYFLYEVIL